jgi:sugar phosphate isomerase/epimerase
MSGARVGLMLYTVRRRCDEDLEATLRAVAGIGYEGVELHDLHGHEAGRVRAWLDELGLVPCGRHAPLPALEQQLPALAAEAGALGIDRLVVSWVAPPETPAEGDELAGRIAAVAQAAAGHGLALGFHNHDGELHALDGAGTFLERLLAEDVFLELDLGWAWWAGVDPVGLLERARGRVPLVHVKDFRDRGRDSFCPVGDGAVGYARVVPAAAAEAEWLLVEQDETDGDALAAAARSYAAVTAMLVAA